ncbi:MAG: TonB-dependent receptor [Bacteroidales bacterium]|nr:TonB-dependent receptor [Bacteroidales bacterium]
MSRAVILAAAFLFAGQAFAQNVSVSGVVTDVSGAPLPGASVFEVGTSNGVIADIDGKYSISVKPQATLEFSFIGMQSQSLAVNGQTSINVSLSEDTTLLEDAVIVAYGVQKKATLTGSVASIKGDAVIQTKDVNTQNMLTGKVAGLRVVQNSSEPGSFDSSISIRNFGSPLIIVDGVPRGNLGRIDGNDIESISVIKDASAAVYGVKAADGVIIITTKQGAKDNFHLTYDFDCTLSTLTGVPEALDAVEYMTLSNEGTMRSYDSPSRKYSQSEMDPYLNGNLKSTDWYGSTLRKITPSYKHTLSATGGSDKVQYYLSLGYVDNQSFYKTNSLHYKQYSFRSNITATPFKDLKITANLWGELDNKEQPIGSAGWTLRSVWRQRPMETVFANNVEGKYLKPSLDGYNPVIFTDIDQMGYSRNNHKFLQSLFSIEYSPSYIKGLSAKASVSYDLTISDNKTNQKAYSLFEYNSTTEKYTESVLNSPSYVQRSYQSDQAILIDASLSYNNTFGNNHVGALALYEEHIESGDGFYGRRYVNFPLDELFAGESEGQIANTNSVYEYVSRAFVGRINYDYAGKYLAEFSCRYDVSSRFSPKKRGGFFPGGSIGYRISEEKFWKSSSALSKINNLKVRASYGVMGRDNSLDFQFLTGYSYPSGGYLFDGKYVGGVADKGLANEDITWETCYTLDVGLDLEAWNGLLGFSFDYFNRLRTGIFGTRLLTLPEISGTSLPQENLNSLRTTGYDMQVSHHHHVGDFYYSISGNLSFAFNQNLYRERSRAGNSYENWRNNDSYRNTGIWWGYGAEGRYDNLGQIYSSSYAGHATLPGDFIYEDWNNDGYINNLVTLVIGYNGEPQIYYGFGFQGSWKGLDFNILFQGAGRHWVYYSEVLGTSLWGGGNSPDYFLDRWHPADPAADPYDPATEWVKGEYAFGGASANENSEFRIQNAAYLRLKSVELGYTLPKNLLQRIHVSSLRFFVNSYNPLTISKIKGLDPEHCSGNGYLYPINTTISVGAQLKF